MVDNYHKWSKRVLRQTKQAKKEEEISAQTSGMTEQDVMHALWARGNVSEFLLDTNQKRMYEAFKSTPARKFVINCSRRTGKSFLCFVLAAETCIRKSGAIVRYVAPSKQSIEQYIIPIYRDVFRTCPQSLKPHYSAQNHTFKFSNGSVIYLTGTEKGSADAARGTFMDLGVVDEARDITDLSYVIGDVLMPQTLTTSGKILITSTPPKSPLHDFTAKYVPQAKAEGAYYTNTILDIPRISAQEVKDMIEEAGGRNSIRCRREWFAELITDSTHAVIPEFTASRKDAIVVAVDRPSHFDCYVASDIGYHDLSVVLFGYYDFKGARLVIEDEIVDQRTIVEQLDARIADKEAAMWGSSDVVYYRVMDAPPIVVEGLNAKVGRSWVVAPKLPKEVGVNAVRDMVIWDRIRIHPRCKTLISHLEHAIWTAKRNKFSRSGEFGHFDALDALIYMERTLNKDRNPYPDPPKPRGEDVIDVMSVFGGEEEKLGQAFFLRKIFNGGRRH